MSRALTHTQVTEGAMKSAFEYFQRAARCEEQAERSTDAESRRVFLATAGQWRKLGDAAKEKEAVVAPARADGSVPAADAVGEEKSSSVCSRPRPQ